MSVIFQPENEHKFSCDQAAIWVVQSICEIADSRVTPLSSDQSRYQFL